MIARFFSTAPAHPRATPHNVHHPGELIFVLFQLLPVDYVRESWWLSEISPWFAGAMLFQARIMFEQCGVP